MTVQVKRHIRDHVTVVNIIGPVDVGHDLHTVIAACVEECPLAVLVDLTSVSDVPPAVLAEIAEAAARLPPDIPSVAVFACGVPAPHQYLLAPHVSTFETPERARLAILDLHRTLPRIEMTFDGSEHAPARVRQLVAETCERWSLQHVRASAMLIMSELVSNVVRHTPDDGRAALTLRDPFLHLEVEDHDARVPVMNEGHVDSHQDHGRGLAIIGMHARWGYRVDHDYEGKVVWASLPTRHLS